jgi:hypothetical protein
VGITITGLERKNHYENVSAPRGLNLLEARKLGIKTWVSYEPVINPDKVLWYIDYLKETTDEIKIGKWNYSPEAKKIDWYKFGYEVEALCQRLGVRYYIKEDLRKAMVEKGDK